MLREFKEFALKGNVIDLAIGVIIGGAFGSIVTSLVNDIIMPLISLLTKGLSFENWFIPLDGKRYETVEMAKEAGAATLNFGTFITVTLNFIIIAFVIFLIVKQINRLKKPAPVTEKTDKECPHCYSSINKKATRCPNCTAELKKSN